MRGAQYRISGRPGAAPTVRQSPGLAGPVPPAIFGDDVWREGAQAEAERLAEILEAPVFATRQIFANFPSRHPLYCGMYPASQDFQKVSGLKPDLLFLIGCQGVHGAVSEPAVMQIGPNPLLMGRHYPLDLAAAMRAGGRSTISATRSRACTLPSE
jgi:thiamine pyrophosphate-dependent acetolactate synthase large subunit-like protein